MEDLNDKINDGGATADGQLGADEWNQIPTEIQNVIEGLGITLSGSDLNQLGKGIAGYVANGNFYTDGGAADAYVLSVIGSKQSAPAYTNGFEAEFIPSNPNTGASTVNIAGLGVKNIKTSAGADPAAGDITDRTALRYDLGNDWFEIVTVTVADASTTIKGIVELLTDAELAAGTDTTRSATAAAIASLFNTSLRSINGYIRLPVKIGGAIVEIIIQWGTHTNSATPGVGTNIILPIAYTNSNFMGLMGNNFTTTSGTTFIITTKTLTTMLSVSNSPSLVGSWISVGY